MSLAKKVFAIAAKIGIAIWGIDNYIDGAAISFSVNGPGQDLATAYIELVYATPFVAAMISFVSTRVASLLLSLSIFISIGILLWSHVFGLGTGEISSNIEAIGLRPGVSLIALFIIGLVESASTRVPDPEE